jgi:predicted SAM-dependent methyltransferase
MAHERIKTTQADAKIKCERIRDWVLRRFTGRIPNSGVKRYCPVCRMPSRRFAEFGIVPREDAKCIWCGALERHRLVWLYFKKMTDLFDGRPKSVLHIAPERMFENLLKHQFNSGYFTADLSDSKAMVRMDITHVDYAEETFDVIYCSHVLEHVSNDRRAIHELHRILKSDGWAVLLIPITADRTFEDPSVTKPSERLKLFGQEDHVRRYGPDFVERLNEAGFKVKVIAASDFLTEEEITHMGITDAAGQIYYCTKK